MTMEINKMALIELGGSHEENLYSQVLFLKKYGFQVHIILFEDHYRRIIAFPEVDTWKCYKKPHGWPAEWYLVFRLLIYLKRQGIRKAVLNTAEGNIVRKLSIAAGSFTEFTGIIHLCSKLWTSRSQKIISRKVKKYFVLADFMQSNIDQTRTAVAIECFYPILFPSEPDQEAGEQHEGEMNHEYQICIPGAVDFAGRDYHSLLDEMLVKEVPEGVRFILLGRTTSDDGKALIARIREMGFEKYFTLFDDFIPHNQFYRILKNAWLVLPLLTPRCKDYTDYLKYKVTGSFNLAYGFQIPMLQHESFAGDRIIRETSVFYQDGNLLETVNQSKENPEMLMTIRERMSSLPEFRFESQAEKYIHFIYGNRHFRP
jgi:hypothetical protein